jgi:hypothetical protein
LKIFEFETWAFLLATTCVAFAQISEMTIEELMAYENARQIRNHGPEYLEQLANSLDPVNQTDSDKLILEGFDPDTGPIYYETHNVDVCEAIDITALWNYQFDDFDINGSSIEGLAIWDAGHVFANHQELAGKVTYGDGGGVSYHSTHVAGTMIARGIDAQSHGVLSEASLKSWTMSGDHSEILLALFVDNLQVSNHSYGSPTGWSQCGENWYWYGDPLIDFTEDWEFGSYTTQTRSIDTRMASYIYFQEVRSSGNHRTEVGPAAGSEHFYFDGNSWIISTDIREPDGGVDGFDSLHPEACAKNALVVGNVNKPIEGEEIQLRLSSSIGPTDDGRIKPDLVSVGSSVYSTKTGSTDSYGLLSGTSISAPSVTALVALLQEVYKSGHASPSHPNGRRRPFSSTIRAAILHNTAEAGSADGPDYKFGWGMLDANAATMHVLYENFTGSSIIESTLPAASTDTLFFESTGGPAKLTLAWTDSPAIPAVEPELNNSESHLIRNIDMVLSSLDTNADFHPWILDPTNPDAPASRGQNVLDNIEQIKESDLSPGSYCLVLKRNDENTYAQRWSLALSGLILKSYLEFSVSDPDPLSGDTLAVDVYLKDAFGIDGIMLDCDWIDSSLDFIAFEEGELLNANGISTTIDLLEADSSGFSLNYMRDAGEVSLDNSAGLVGRIIFVNQSESQRELDFAASTLIRRGGQNIQILCPELLLLNPVIGGGDDIIWSEIDAGLEIGIDIGGESFMGNQAPRKIEKDFPGGDDNPWRDTLTGGSDAVDLENFPLNPEDCSISEPWPNPFNPQTRFQVTINTNGFAGLEVYDILGRRIESLYHGWLNAGNHEFNWTAPADLSSANYFLTLTTSSGKVVQKVCLLR